MRGTVARFRRQFVPRNSCISIDSRQAANKQKEIFLKKRFFVFAVVKEEGKKRKPGLRKENPDSDENPDMSGCAAIFVQAWAMQRVHASVILACFAGECASAAFDAAVLMQLEAAVFEAAICLRSYVSCSRALCGHACSSLGAALLPLMVPADEGVFAAFEGLREEWDNHRRLRERVRSLGRLVVDKPKEGEAEEAGQVVAKTVENMKYNAPALKPMMEKMRGQFHVVPQIESLQAELQALYISAGLNPSGKVISDQAWSLRYLYSLLKKYLYNKTPPRVTCLNAPLLCPVQLFASISPRMLALVNS